MSARTILKHVYENGGMTEYQYERIDRVLKERERPRGEWVESDDGDELYGNFEQCSKCFALVLSTHMNFCGNCGADMREGEEKC